MRVSLTIADTQKERRWLQNEPRDAPTRRQRNVATDHRFGQAFESHPERTVNASKIKIEAKVTFSFVCAGWESTTNPRRGPA